MIKAKEGLTLTEVLIASTLALIVVIGIGQIDVARVRLAEDIRQRSGVTSIGRLSAAIAAMQFAQHVEQADRLILCQDGSSTAVVGAIAPCASSATQLDTDVIFRTPVMTSDGSLGAGACTSGPPDPRCFDIAANYRWDEFRFNSSTTTGELKLYTNIGSGGPPSCGNEAVVARQIVSFSVIYTNATNDPVLGAPPTGTNLVSPANNNVLLYNLIWQGVDNVGVMHSELFPGEVTLRNLGYTNTPTGIQNPLPGLDISPPPSSSCPP